MPRWGQVGAVPAAGGRMTHWSLSNCGAWPVRVFAAPHYSRKNPDSSKVGGPGFQLVLTSGDPVRAVWMTTRTLPEFTKHAWPGAWNNSLFRNDGAGLSSELIRSAIAVTRHEWGEPPEQGLITFVDAGKIRHKRDPGRCYLRAGFRLIGTTAGGLLTFHLSPSDMPAPEAPHGPMQAELFPRTL